MTIAMTFMTSDAYREVEQRGHLSKIAKWQRLDLTLHLIMFFSHTNTLIDIHLLVNSFSRSVSQSISLTVSQFNALGMGVFCMTD